MLRSRTIASRGVRGGGKEKGGKLELPDNYESVHLPGAYFRR